jgi:hypothetical protein
VRAGQAVQQLIDSSGPGAANGRLRFSSSTMRRIDDEEFYRLLDGVVIDNRPVLR